MKIMFNDLNRIHNSIKKDVLNSFTKVIERNNFILGEEVEIFEDNFAKYTNSKYAISCANGTEAIELLLRSSGVSVNDEVLLPVNSFIATAIAVSRIGATPIFFDCDEYYLSDVDDMKKKITSKTKAIITVHLYGQMSHMKKIKEVAKNFNLILIEDSAQAHGAKQQSNSPGKYSNGAAYSFYPGKNLGAWGDGGMVTTNSKTIRDEIIKLRNYGSDKKYIHNSFGFNSRLDTLQAIVLNEKLKYIDSWNNDRNICANYYIENLANLKKIILPKTIIHNLHTWHLFVIRVKNRNKFIDYMSSHGIDCGIHYPKIISNQKMYKNHLQYETIFENASNFEKELVSLPIFPLMNPKELDYVVRTIVNY